jgi:hypothetical protein
LRELGEHFRRADGVEIVVRVSVNESGREDSAVAVNDAAGGEACAGPGVLNPISADGYFSRLRTTTAAVENADISD